MSKAIIKRKVESAGVSYPQAEQQAIDDIRSMKTEGFERTSDISVVQRKFRGGWRFVATFQVSKSMEVGP